MLQLQHVRSEDALNGHNQMHAAAPRLFGKSVALIAASELNNPLLFASSFLPAASPGRLGFFIWRKSNILLKRACVATGENLSACDSESAAIFIKLCSANDR